MEATKQTYTPTKGNAGYYQAVANKVKADYLKDTLASQKAQGVIDDQTYLTKLTDLANQYANGTGINMGLLQNVAEQRTNTAQSEYDTLQKQRQEAKINTQQYFEGLKALENKYSQFGDVGRLTSSWRLEQETAQNQLAYDRYKQSVQGDVNAKMNESQANLQDAINKVANNEITMKQFKAIQKAHLELTKSAEKTYLPTYNEWLENGGLNYQRPETTQRTEKIKGIFRSVLGKTPEKKIENYAKSYFSLPWIKQTLSLKPSQIQKRYFYNQPRNVAEESKASQDLISKLGRAPSLEEISAYVYGKYPVELIKNKTYNTKKKHK